MLSVRIEGYHALEILRYQADKLNDLLSRIPHDIALQDPEVDALASGLGQWSWLGVPCGGDARSPSSVTAR
jgi:hypothetical protein